MKSTYPITLLCEVLGVSRSGYFAWAGGRRARREGRDAELTTCIHAAFADSRQTYGYPRLTDELRARGERVGKTRVARLMRSAGLQGRHPAPRRPLCRGPDPPFRPRRAIHQRAFPPGALRSSGLRLDEPSRQLLRQHKRPPLRSGNFSMSMRVALATG
jgi:hypothetical protein